MPSQKILLAFGGWSAVLAAEPNPPSWPDSVQVFSPSDDSGKIAGAIAAAFAINGGHSPSYVRSPAAY